MGSEMCIRDRSALVYVEGNKLVTSLCDTVPVEILSIADVDSDVGELTGQAPSLFNIYSRFQIAAVASLLTVLVLFLVVRRRRVNHEAL